MTKLPVDKEVYGSKMRVSYHDHKKSRITYESFVWIVFGITTILAIIDRFKTNIWPRQAFSIGSGSAGNDRMVGYKPGPWSVVAYDVIARISGRFSICAFNIVMITRIRYLEHRMLCSKWVNMFIDCSDIINANLRLHKWNAIALCILTVIHVWSILFPCVVHGYTAKVIPGTFEWPLSERTPPGFKDADPIKKQMGLQVDDVWRMVEMTVMLCILTPLSVRWLKTRWHIGMPLHRIINVLYFVDIVRRHSHPHSWVLNTPVFCFWLFDKFWMWYANRLKSPEMHRTYLGNDYMILYWKHRETNLGSYDKPETRPIISPDYFLRLRDSSFFESAHVFTCFENRNDATIHRPGENPFEWTVGSVVRVFRKKRKLRLGAKDPISHTARIFDAPRSELDMTAWGPFHSDMSAHIKEALLDQDGPTPIFVGTGSGVAYILDVLQWREQYVPEAKVKILFSTRDIELFKWVKATVEPFASKKVLIQLALTGIDIEQQQGILAADRAREMELDDEDEDEEEIDDSDSDSEASDYDSDAGLKKPIFEKGGKKSPYDRNNCIVRFSHHDFHEEIEKGTIVFSQGSRGLNDHIGKICREKKVQFFGGLQTSTRTEMFGALIESIHRSICASTKWLNPYGFSLKLAFWRSDRDAKTAAVASAMKVSNLDVKPGVGEKLDDTAPLLDLTLTNR